MKTRWLFLVVGVLFPNLLPAAEDLPQPVVVGLKNPSAATVGAGSKIYVAVTDTSDKDFKTSVVLIKNSQVFPFATGLDETRGLVAHQQWLFATEQQRVQRIDSKGKASVYVEATDFPVEPQSLSAWSWTHKTARFTFAMLAMGMVRARRSTELRRRSTSASCSMRPNFPRCTCRADW